jgi:ribosomal protein S18 acetylase RimI-like enzyme
VTIDTFADPEFWTKDDNPDDAVYVHRMIVQRAFGGRGLGKVMLLFAETIASRAGRHWVRLDAWSTNSSLHAYYRSLGFEHVRTLRFQHRGSGALFQRAVPEQPVVSDVPWSANHLTNPANHSG